jgi:hydroxyacylglutathione hydrolase
MLIETIPVGALQVNCYVLGCETTRQAIVIDPGDEAGAILAALEQHGLTLAHILATHGHFDHLLACRKLQERTGAALYLHPADRPLVTALRRTCMAWLGYDPGQPPKITGDLTPGEIIQAGDIALEVRHTPGHSPGSVTLVDPTGRRAFTGDALFAGSIGRTDLPGGDMQTLLASIRTQILSLPDDYAVLSGHGEASTVGDERGSNPFLTGGMRFGAWR